ncbi:MAG: exo-alpha-sialidase [Nocardioidaceae bacterium]|nr:exo-alpha-sialidase [Nocardioidaceae bacterium]
MVDVQDVQHRVSGPLLAALLIVAVGPSAPASAEEPVWQPPTTLGVADPDELTIVTDDAGNDTAAWFRRRTVGGVAFAEPVVAQRAAGDTWSLPTVMGRASHDPDITLATTPSGQITAVWVNETLDGSGAPTEAQLQISVFDHGQWSAAATLWRGNRAKDPVIAVDPSGRAVLAWTRVGARNAAFVATRDVEGTWSAPRRLDDGSRRAVWARGAGIGDNGIAVVTYVDNAGVHAARWTGASWSGSRRLTKTRPTELAFAVSPDGRAAIAYTASRTAPVRERMMNGAGGWSVAKRIDSRSGPVDDHALSLAACPKGGWGVAWATGLHQLRLREFDAATWRKDRVIHRAVGTPRETHLIYHNNGDAMLIWNEDLPTPFAAQIKALTRTSRDWTPDAVSVSGNETNLVNLRAVDNLNGHIVVAWDRVNSGPDQIQSASALWANGTVIN